MRRLVRLALILLVLADDAQAQEPARAATMRAGYAEWLVRHDVTGTGAFAHAGVPTTAIGKGTVPVDRASVGKSITALCAAALSDEGRLDFEARVRDSLGRGPDVSVASLVTHTSGIVDDITQPLMALWLNTERQRAEIGPLP